MEFLDIFKELKLILELLTIWTVPDGSQRCVSGAVAHWLPTLKKDPDKSKISWNVMTNRWFRIRQYHYYGYL